MLSIPSDHDTTLTRHGGAPGKRGGAASNITLVNVLAFGVSVWDERPRYVRGRLPPLPWAQPGVMSRHDISAPGAAAFASSTALAARAGGRLLPIAERQLCQASPSELRIPSTPRMYGGHHYRWLVQADCTP